MAAMRIAPRSIVRIIPLVIATCGVAACGSNPAVSPSGAPVPVGQGVPSHGSGCVTTAEATRVWNGIDAKLNAIEADPKHGGASYVATGSALNLIEQYLAQQLEANSFTEIEVDKLESVAIVDAGCNNGTLKLRVTMTLVKDDYVKANGKVDHADPAVGKTLHYNESFVRAGGVWKESDFQNLDNPPVTQTPQLV